MLTAEDCLEIIENAYPDLWIRDYAYDDKGQNNVVLIVNNELVFRFPRTAHAARRLGIEAAILGALQSRVTLQVPNPIYLSLGGKPAKPKTAVPKPDRPKAPDRPPGGSVSRAAGALSIPGEALSVPTSRLSGSQGSSPYSPYGALGLGARRHPAWMGRAAGERGAVPGQVGPDGRRPWERGLGGHLPWEGAGGAEGATKAPAPGAQGGTQSRPDQGSPTPPIAAGRSRSRRSRQSGRQVTRSSATDPAARGVFMGYRWIPGEQLWRDIMLAATDQRILQNWADQLASFLAELHGARISGELAKILRPYDPRARWDNFYQRVRNKVFPHMRPEARAAVARDFDAFLGNSRNFAFKMSLVHGDFGPGNILIDAPAQRVAGVIDFGSSGLDDPAVDFAALIGPFGYGEAFLHRFTRFYPISEADLERARFYASTFPLQDAVFGIENNDAQAFQWGIEPYR